MAGPMQMYLYVHDAILRAVAGYEERARGLDAGSAAEVGAFADELTWFHSMVKLHEHAEEQVLFPAMNERFRFVAETYAFDHDDFEPHVFGGLDAALTGLREPGGRADQRSASDLLRRQCAHQEPDHPLAVLRDLPVVHPADQRAHQRWVEEPGHG